MVPSEERGLGAIGRPRDRLEDVALLVEEAVKAERERCARIADKYQAAAPPPRSVAEGIRRQFQSDDPVAVLWATVRATGLRIGAEIRGGP